MEMQDLDSPAAENAFTQALQQPNVVKDQFDLLYASIFGRKDDSGNQITEDDIDGAIVLSSQNHQGKVSSKYLEDNRWMIDRHDEEEEVTRLKTPVAPVSKKRRRASFVDFEKVEACRALISPRPPNYDEEKLRSAWKPLAPAEDDFLDVSLSISRQRGPNTGYKVAEEKAMKSKQAVRCRKGEGGEESDVSCGGEWLQSRTALVSERNSIVPKHVNTSTSSDTAHVTPTMPCKARGAAPLTAGGTRRLSSGSGSSTGSHQSRSMGSFFSPRPRFLGLSPEGAAYGTEGRGGSVMEKKSLGREDSGGKSASAVSKRCLPGCTPAASYTQEKPMPPSALFSVLKKSIFSHKAF